MCKLNQTIEEALLTSMSDPRNRLDTVVETVCAAVKDRLAQDVQTAEFKGETPVEMFKRMFPEQDDDSGPLSY